jgi:hypothetical protein
MSRQRAVQLPEVIVENHGIARGTAEDSHCVSGGLIEPLRDTRSRQMGRAANSATGKSIPAISRTTLSTFFRDARVSSHSTRNPAHARPCRPSACPSLQLLIPTSDRVDLPNPQSIPSSHVSDPALPTGLTWPWRCPTPAPVAAELLVVFPRVLSSPAPCSSFVS